MSAEKPSQHELCTVHGIALSAYPCRSCGGDGERAVDDDDLNDVYWETCPICRGSGEEMACDICVEEEDL